MNKGSGRILIKLNFYNIRVHTTQQKLQHKDCGDIFFVSWLSNEMLKFECGDALIYSEFSFTSSYGIYPFMVLHSWASL